MDTISNRFSALGRAAFVAIMSATVALLFQVSPALAQTPILVDFEGLAPGSQVTDITVDGLTVSVEATGGIGEAWIFDSSAPTGGDQDLGTPNQNCDPAGPGVGTGGLPGTPGENCVALGNILIIQENPGTIPDDAKDGGTITFTFSEAVIVNYFDLLDFEEDTTPSITFYDGNGIQLGTPISPTGLGDNSYERFDPEVDAGVFEVVTTIMMDLPISGAVGGIEVVRASEVLNMGSIGDTITCVDTGAPLAGVLVTLTDASGGTQSQNTDASGKYLFEALALGDYTVTVDPSTITGSCNLPAVDPDGVLDNMSTLTLTAGAPDNLEQDFAYTAPAVDPLGSIGDTITCVDTGAPLAGVLVTLTDASGGTQSQNTDANGKYLFESLPLGDYTVAVDPSTITGSCNSPAVDPDDVLDNMSTLTLTAGAPDNLEQDFAYTAPAVDPLGSIGDTITCVDTGDPLAGVLVTLISETGAPQMQNTAADGTYLFENLPLGDYSITVDPSTITGSCNQPAVDPDGVLDNSSTATLTADAPDNLDQDFAYTAPDGDQFGSIGDTIFCDANGNDVPDAGEGLANVTVTLGGAAAATTNTDANGLYLFTELTAGDYTVTVDMTTIPATCTMPSVDPDDVADCASALTLGAGENNRDQDFGYVAPAPALGSIGDTIFCDANGNNVPDNGEGLIDVAVNLSGASTASTTTDANGTYLFANLMAGDYTVTVDETTIPASCNIPSAAPTGASNGSSTLTLGAGEDNFDQDFGYVAPAPVLGSIGDTLFCDANGNNAPDSGEGMADITVALGGDATASATTGADGTYLFENLAAGNYTITVDPFSVPATCNVPTVDPDGGNDNTSAVTLGAGEDNLDQDFGFVAPAQAVSPQLTLVKNVANTVVARGDTLVYTLEYSNIGDGDAEGVQLNEGVPEGATFDPTSSSPDWVCTGTTPGSACTLDVGTVPANTVGDPVPFAIIIDSDLPDDIIRITCVATINSSTPNPSGAVSVSTGTDITPGAPDNVDVQEEPSYEVVVYLPFFQ